MNHIVLYEPEIPQNTGNIMRTCVATNSRLHLIEPLGFLLSEKHIKRSGLDYRGKLDMRVYPDFASFLKQNQGIMYFLTRYGDQSPDMFDYRSLEQEHYFIFGKESTGIPKAILKEYLDRCIRLPMASEARTLNLSNAVAIVIYEALRQQEYKGLSRYEPETMKGKDYLKR